jgi:hypothetical protein
MLNERVTTFARWQRKGDGVGGVVAYKPQPSGDSLDSSFNLFCQPQAPNATLPSGDAPVDALLSDGARPRPRAQWRAAVTRGGEEANSSRAGVLSTGERLRRLDETLRYITLHGGSTRRHVT